MDPFLINRPANDEGLRRVLSVLSGMEQQATEIGAMLSQVSASSDTNTVSPWKPATSWGDVAAVSLERPEWAESVILYVGGYILPDWADTVTDVRCWGRIVATDGVTTKVSPSMMSTVMSIDTSATLTWTLPISPLSGDTVKVSTQSYNLGGVSSGGSASVTAVALWMR